MSLRVTTPTPGLARSLAVVAATPAVEGVVLVPDALIDLSGPLWDSAPFTAVLLGQSDIADLTLPQPLDPVVFLSAVPITARANTPAMARNVISWPATSSMTTICGSFFPR